MKPSQRRARLPEAIVRFSFGKPRLIFASWFLAVAVSTLGISALRIETTVDSVLDRSSDDWLFYQESQRVFGGDEVIVLMISSPVGYDTELMKRVSVLSRELRAIPGVRRVDSAATVPSVAAGDEGDLIVEPPITSTRLAEPNAGAAVRRLVEADESSRGLLVSGDGRSFGLNVLLEQGAYERSGEILSEIAELAGDGARWSGVPVFRNETNKRTERELLAFVPATAALILVLLLFLFRSVVLALLPLVTSGVSVAVVVGAMGALELPMTISTLILPTVLLALGCAYSMHLVSAALAPATSGLAADLEDRLAGVALPVALSGLTTAIGFVAISSVRIDALRQVGGLGGLGAMIATLAVLTLLPSLLAMVRLPSESMPHRWLRRDAPAYLVRAIGRNHFAVIILSAGVCGVALAGLSQLRVESDVIQWFPKDDPLRIAYAEIRDELSGISPVNVVVRAVNGESVAEPSVLLALSAMSRHLEALPNVSRAISIATPIDQVHSVLGGGESVTDAAMIDQYLLVLSAAEHVQDLVSFDRTSANVWVRSKSNASEDLLEVAREAEHWWQQNGPVWTTAKSTGIMFEFARAQRAISWGQVTGLGLAFLAIAVVLYLAFGSLGMATIALLPNIVPILISFGLLGWLDVPLDAGTVLVGNLALGIAVDDTIHLVSALQRDEGSGFLDRFASSLPTVLPPLCLTTIVLALGFAVLGLSSFLFIRNLGLLTALILVVCLAADLLLLPSVLLARDARVRRAFLKATP